MRRQYFLLAVLCVFLSGCFVLLSEERTDYGSTGVKFYDVNMVRSSPFVGVLFVQCRPTRRAAVKEYYIKVDQRPPLRVTKESDVKMYIDAGRHELVIGAVEFGRASVRKVLVRDDRQTVVIYRGPYWSWSAGRLQ